MLQRWLIAFLRYLYQFRTIFDSGRQLFELVPIGGRAQPFGIGREQHLHAMPELACDERWVHAGHQAHGCVGVSGVVLPAPTDTQSIQRGMKVLNGNTRLLDPQPAFAWWKDERAFGERRCRGHVLQLGDASRFL